MTRAFDELLATIVVIPNSVAFAPCVARGMDHWQVIDVLYMLLEEEQRALVDSSARTEAEAILALAQGRARELQALLLGLEDLLLGTSPGHEEWPLGRVLNHILEVEQRYLVSCVWARDRSEADPLRPPDQMYPAEIHELPASMDLILGQIMAAREESDRELAATRPDRLERPTIWAGIEVDLRYRLHRFASHHLEHTIQCEKALFSLGRPPGEARRIGRQIASLRGQHERLSGAHRIETIDQESTALLTRALASTGAAGPSA